MATEVLAPEGLKNNQFNFGSSEKSDEAFAVWILYNEILSLYV